MIHRSITGKEQHLGIGTGEIFTFGTGEIFTIGTGEIYTIGTGEIFTNGTGKIFTPMVLVAGLGSHYCLAQA